MPPAELSDQTPHLKPEQLLIEDFREASTHYRHLESTRTRYLGFFTSLIIASVALLLALLRDAGDVAPTDGQAIGDWMVGGLYLFGMVLFFVTGLMLAAVRKIGLGLRHFNEAQRRVRSAYYSELEPELRRTVMEFGFDDNPRFREKGDILVVQHLAERSMAAIGVVIVALMVVGLYGVFAADTSRFVRGTAIVITAIAICSSIWLGALLSRVAPPGKWKPDWWASGY